MHIGVFPRDGFAPVHLVFMREEEDTNERARGVTQGETEGRQRHSER